MTGRRRIAGVLAVLRVAAALGLLATAAAAQQPAALDPSARMEKGGSATEQWDFTAVLDSGHRVVARFIVTNTGPGSRNAVVLGHVIRPDGSSELFKQGRRSNRWTLSDDRRVLDIGSSHLQLRDPNYRLHIAKSAVKIDLSFAPDSHEPTPREALPAGYSLDLLALSAAAEGTLWLEGMAEPLAVRGHVALVHSWTKQSEGEVLHRRIDAHKLGDDVAMYGVHLTAPQGTTSSWFVAARDSKTLAAGDAFAVNLTGNIGDLKRSGYWVPAGIQLSGDGASGAIALQKTLLETDPLRVIPSFLRWVVSLTMKPHRVWAESQFDVTLPARSGDSPLRVQGTGVTTLTFLNPLKR